MRKKLTHKKTQSEAIQEHIALILKNNENFGGEKFNEIIDTIEASLVSILKYDSTLTKLDIAFAELEIGYRLMWQLGCGLQEKNKETLRKTLDGIMDRKITMVVLERFRRFVVLKTLDEILNISSAEEFGERHYKIRCINVDSFDAEFRSLPTINMGNISTECFLEESKKVENEIKADVKKYIETGGFEREQKNEKMIEINSYEDLQNNREKLQEMYKSFCEYDNPLFDNVDKYARENNLKINFYPWKDVRLAITK